MKSTSKQLPADGKAIATMRQGLILTVVMVLVALALDLLAGTGWDWTSIAIVLLTAGSVMAFMPSVTRGIARPYGGSGYDIHDVYVRTTDAERRSERRRVGRSEAWNLIPPVTAVIIIVLFRQLT